MVQSDSKRIVWHPTKPRRFVIGGAGGVGNAGGASVGQIKVYDWDGSSEIAEVTTLGDLIHMKCFALSPHPLDADLIAVGTTQGKIELLRFSITHPPNTLRSPAVSSLSTRSSRACNALAFSSYDPNYLAVGLDKVRGEPSLVIWDIETTSSKVFNPKLTGGRGDDALTPLQNPPGEFTPKTNMLFTRSDPLLPSNIPPNIPRYDRNIIQQWLHTETVTSLSFMPHTTDLIVAGVSHRWIRLFDLRSPSGVVGFTGSNTTGLNTSTSGSGTATPSTTSTNPQSISTKSVYGLCTNPFDHHQFASFGEDGVVRIWDHRYFTSPVLSFSERDALADGADINSITAIEFSKTRRGSILSLEKDAYAVRLWDTIRATVEERWDNDINIGGRQGNIRNQSHAQTGQGEGTSRISKLARLPWSTTTSSPTTTPAASLSSTVVESSTMRPYLTNSTKPSIKTEYVILRNTRTSSRFFRPLASFTSIPHPSHWGWSSKSDDKFGQTMSMSIAVLTKDGELDMQTIYDAPVPHWSARGELSVNFGRGYRVYQPRDEEDTEDLAGSLSGLSFRGKDKKPGRQKQGDIHAASTHAQSSRPASLKRFPLSNSTPDLLQTPRPGVLTLVVEKDADPNESRGRTTIAVDAYTAQIPTHRQSSAFASATAPRSRRSVSKGKLSTGERSSRRTIMDDVSMVMKRRAAKGYGLDSLDLNSSIVKSDTFYTDTLYELWTWIDSSRTLLSRHPRIHGFNFSYQGVYGIWEGFPADAKAKHLHKERDGGNETIKETLSPEAPSDAQDNESVGTRGHSRSRNTTSTSTSSTLSTTMSMYRSHSPSNDYMAALQVLSGYYIRSEKDRILDDDVLTASSNVRIAAPTSKLVQRKFCLLLCGWCLSDQELLKACAQWERDGQLTRAACWLLFINHQDKAIECLMRSDDERLRIMSGTIAALLAQQGTSNQVREHYNRLIVRIEDPYIRVMLTHVALDDWSDILQEESLPLRERLAIAFRFLDDRSLSSYLRRLTETFRQRGDIEGVILTGLTPLGFEVIQGYVDTTGDVQTASVLASLTVMSSAVETRIWAQKWIEAYRTLLDTWQMFHPRCQFDISRGKIIREYLDREWEDVHSHTIPHSHPHISSAQAQVQVQAPTYPELDWTRPQLAIRCPFCKKNVNLGLSPRLRIGDGGKIRVNCCQTCGRSLPRCAICLVVLGLGYDLERDTEMTDGSTEKNTINDALVFCQTCKHGGHASHMLEWFYGSDASPRHNECPVPGCDCLCGLK